MESVLAQLSNYKVIVCAGTGGVGKTSVSAALGMAAAYAGKKVLVLTIDPAKRLKTALGLDELNHVDLVNLKLENCKGILDAGVVNPKKVFDEFVKKSSPDESSAKLLLDNLLYQKLSLGLQGSQEFTSLERFYSAYESGDYDLIILDTPPSQHAVDFLEAPARLAKLFDESVLKFFVSESESKFKVLNRVVRSGTKKVFGLLEKLTGKQFVDEIFNFFVSMKQIRPALVKRNKEIDKLLHDKHLGFLLVTAYDEKKIDQAIDFHKRLKQSGFNFAGLVMNRCFPDQESLRADQSSTEKFEYFKKLKDYYNKEELAYSKILKEMGGETLNIRIKESVGGADALSMISRISEELKWSSND